jgi:hypothetical protein
MSYCTKEEVNNLFGDISDDITDEMFSTVIDNSTAWIDSNIKKSYVPLPTITIRLVNDDGSTTVVESMTSHTATYNLINVPNGLRTAAIYYAASDILLSLYHGDELPVQYDVWFNKAQGLLDDYISSYLNSEADEADLVAHQMVKHSHGLTYNEKRGRKRWRI